MEGEECNLWFVNTWQQKSVTYLKTLTEYLVKEWEEFAMRGQQVKRTRVETSSKILPLDQCVLPLDVLIIFVSELWLLSSVYAKKKYMNREVIWSSNIPANFLLKKSPGQQPENCALLSYYAASSGNFLPTFRDNVLLLNNPEERSSHQKNKFSGNLNLWILVQF
jgi:hypothetical protein